jgi:hypothetical protein
VQAAHVLEVGTSARDRQWALKRAHLHCHMPAAAAGMAARTSARYRQWAPKRVHHCRMPTAAACTAEVRVRAPAPKALQRQREVQVPMKVRRHRRAATLPPSPAGGARADAQTGSQGHVASAPGDRAIGLAVVGGAGSALGDLQPDVQLAMLADRVQ